MSLRSGFDRFSKSASAFTGRPSAFVIAVTAIIVWSLTGPIFHYSDTWQLVVNTATTIITFLMVFLIQNTQNRDIAATQVKLDELIRATRGATNALLDLEEMDEDTLERMRQRYERLADAARKRAAAKRQRRASNAAAARPAAPASSPASGSETASKR